MAPKGFEPSTPGLKVQCSNQAELRSHYDKLNLGELVYKIIYFEKLIL